MVWLGMACEKPAPTVECPAGWFTSGGECWRYEPPLDLDAPAVCAQPGDAGGSCNNTSCPPGCSCASLKAVRLDGGEIAHGYVVCYCGGSCSAPSCGSISCGTGCACGDADAGSCGCGV